jgi:PAS domain S-box-containing protein
MAIDKEKILNIDSTDLIADLTASEASTILKNSKNGVVTGDIWGYISDVNRVLVMMFGAKSKKDFVGKHVLNFVSKEDRTRVNQNSMDSIESDKGKIETYKITQSDGKEVPLKVKMLLIKDRQNVKVGFLDIVKVGVNENQPV